MSRRENVFTQLGTANYKIAQLLCKDEDLRRYLKYSIENPMDSNLETPALEDVWNNNIRTKPLIHLDELRESFCLVTWDYGSVGYNTDFSSLALHGYPQYFAKGRIYKGGRPRKIRRRCHLYFLRCTYLCRHYSRRGDHDGAAGHLSDSSHAFQSFHSCWLLHDDRHRRNA